MMARRKIISCGRTVGGFRVQRPPFPMGRGATCMFWEPSPCVAVNLDVNCEHVSRCATAVPRVGFRSLQVQDFTHDSKVASVRAAYRQVIDVVAIVIENAFRPYNGRSVGQRLLPVARHSGAVLGRADEPSFGLRVSLPFLTCGGRRSAHFRMASRAGHRDCPHDVRLYSTLGGTCG
jgi:hypothetical protein